MSILRKFSLLLLVTFASAVQAEEVTPLRTIHPGTVPVFEQLVQRYKAAAEKLGNRPNWFACSPGIGNDLQ
ncbi:MAG: hypothetical protein ACJAXW_002469 [Candidatus Azotimanducaceae bacterium]|jgi:hypothetical protein